MSIKIPTGITRFVGNNALLLKKNSPTLLFGAGIIGFVATTVIASRATLKVSEVLDHHDDEKREMDARARVDAEYDEFQYGKDVATLYTITAIDIAKLYGPAVVCGSLSIVALTSSHHILNKRNAALSAAYAAVDKAFTQYRDRVRADLGEEKDLEYRYGGSVENGEPVNKDGQSGKSRVFKTKETKGSMYARFFDETNPLWSPVPAYNKIFLQSQQRYANDKLIARGHIFLNEIYDGLGIERTPEGSVVGWVISEDGDNCVDFGIFNPNSPGAIDFVNGNEAAILLDFNVDGVIYDKIGG